MADKRIKLVVVGNSYVGKTSMLFAYTEQKFLDNYQTTIFDNYAVTVNMEQRKYTVNLFDTAGQEDYAHLRVLSYPQTDVFLLCFSLVDPASLEACQSVWMPEIRKYTGERTPVVLVGTKEDLVESSPIDNRVDVKTAQRAASEMGCDKFLTCSSLTLRRLKTVFDEAILMAAGHPTTAKHKDSDTSEYGKPFSWSSLTACCHPL
ncbi:ras family domain-containing protein [Ditylenchus destructor]|nr:ras family domain-containing protein [Ditylenchus destructor]